MLKHNASRALSISILVFINMFSINRALAVDSSSVTPGPVKNMQINCKFVLDNNFTTTYNYGGHNYGNNSIRAWETNYTETDNAEIRCPNNTIMVGQVNWHHSDGAGNAHHMSDIRGVCQYFHVDCTAWQ